MRKLHGIVCGRVADVPAPNTESVERKCARCTHPVWVAYYNVKLADTSLPVICTHCIDGFVKEVKGDSHDA